MKDIHGLDLLRGGQAFVEGLRWHNDALYYSDFHLQEVAALGLDGAHEVVHVLAGDQPSGLGWLADGRLLVVAMQARQVLRSEHGALVLHADLSKAVSWPCNDMVVDRQGRAYVGNFGGEPQVDSDPVTGRFRVHRPSPPTSLVMVTPDGEWRVVCEPRLIFPNGMAITQDGRTLVVAETVGRRLGAFDIREDGHLENYRLFATIDGFPDGISLDEQNGVWFADTDRQACFRVEEGGETTHRVQTSQRPFCCTLGGPERRHLFVATGELGAHELQLQRRIGRIEVTEVDVPGAGIP